MILKSTQKFTFDSLTPRYYQLYVSLRDRIESGEFAENGIVPTERELCETYGISRITAIKALEILETEGVIERQQGRGTFIKKITEGQQKDNNLDLTVAFISGFIDKLPVNEILMGLVEVLAQSRIPLLVFGYADNSEAEAQAVKKAVAMGVNGIIVCPRGDNLNSALFKGVLTSCIPLVMTDRYYPDLQADYVIHDDWQGGYELTTRLLQKGHQKIAFAIADEVLPTSVLSRLAGYKAALEKFGLPYDENLVWLNVMALVHPEKRQNMQEVLKKDFYDNLLKERPTGLVAVNYDVAMFLREVIFERSSDAGLHSDYIKTIEINSFDHRPSPVYESHITTLAMQPGKPMGIEAANIMIERLIKNDHSSSRHIKLPMNFVEFQRTENFGF